MIYPKVLLELIEYFKKFPGIGDKSAERMALALLDINRDDVNSFANAMLEAKNKLHSCNICGCLTDNDVCMICSNEFRRDNLICILEDFKGVFAFEKTGKYNGKYHVLNGLISPIDDRGPEDINLSSLIDRVKTLENPEVIIALKPSIEGETTTLYIKKILEDKGVKISRLSYGIPMGVDIDLASLIDRIKDKDSVEVIIALKPSIEGETTTLYIKEILSKYSNVKVSRLSYGIPMGVDIDYLDELTLLNALNERKNLS